MNMRRNDRLARLVEAALGEAPESSLRDLTRAESARLGQLRTLGEGLKSEWHKAPESVVRAALEVFPGPAPVGMKVASLRATATRAATAETLHVGYEHDGVRVRAVFSSEPNGWRIIGQISGGAWTFVSGDEVGETDSEGRFEVFVRGAEAPDVLFVRDVRRLLVTPPQSKP